MNGYERFTRRRYMGGHQARYYLCDIPFMALAMAEGMYLLSRLKLDGLLMWCQKRLPAVKPLQTLKAEKCTLVYTQAVKVLGVIFIFWMLYGDFIYFLCEHDVY